MQLAAVNCQQQFITNKETLVFQGQKLSVLQLTLVLTLLPPPLTPGDVLAQPASSNNTTSLPNPLHRGHHAIKFLDFLTYLGKRHSLHPMLTLPEEAVGRTCPTTPR